MKQTVPVWFKETATSPSHPEAAFLKETPNHTQTVRKRKHPCPNRPTPNKHDLGKGKDEKLWLHRGWCIPFMHPSHPRHWLREPWREMREAEVYGLVRDKLMAKGDGRCSSGKGS